MFTQRREFQAGQEILRQGALLSVKHSGEFYNILFLHTDSGRKRKDYTNRQTMFEKIGRLKYTLDQLQTSNSRLIVIGDLNTMGRDEFGDQKEVTDGLEIAQLNRDIGREEMQVLMKTQKVTNLWSGGESDLDHVLATGNISFKEQQESETAPVAQVRVYGWNQLGSKKEKEKFRKDVSDHSLIYCEVE